MNTSSHPARLFLLTVTVLLISISAPPLIQADDAAIHFQWTKVTDEPAIGIDWSPDGNFIIFDNSDADKIALLNWKTGAIIWRTPFPKSDFIYGTDAFSARWSPDGQWIAAATEGTIYLIDPRTGHFNGLRTRVPAGRDQPAYVLPRWGNDSNLLAVLDTNGFIDVLRPTTGEIIQTIDITSGVNWAEPNYTAFDWSPDGQLFVAAYQNLSTVREIAGFWDRNGTLLQAYTQESVTDPDPHTPCPRNANSPIADDLTYFEWANDSRTLVVGETYGLAICRLNIDGTIDLQPLQSYGTMFHWSPDQRWLAGAINTDPAIWIADVANNYHTVSSHPPGGSQVTSFAWSPDSEHLAVGTIHELWIGTLI